MKKSIKILIAVVLAATLLATISIPAMAKGFDFENAVEEYDQHIQTLYFKAGESDSLFDYEAENGAVFYSSDESIAVISKGGTIAAKDGGKAYIAVVFPDGAFNLYKCDVEPRKSSGAIIDDGNINNNISEGLGGINQVDWLENRKNERKEFYDSIKEKQEDETDVMEILGPILILLIVSLVLAEIGYIFVTAPKLGMSRFWALVPLFSNFFGLIVFIIVRSNRKTSVSTHSITCPTCSSVHPAGTTMCSICGTNLRK